MHWLETHWYRLSPLHLVLWPLSLVFGALAALRRMLYCSGLLNSIKLAVPVVMVGNINVGGTGKTPCVIWLVSWLASRGLKPGIISRGYGGTTRHPQEVTRDTDPALVGDEAVLLARRCACPVWTGSSRIAAARALLAANPACDVIISDDGLQHYALKRDVELVVLDGERGCGNGMLLPAGPLRESLSRLECVDALIINGGAVFPPDMLPSGVPAFDMRLDGETFYALRPPHQEVGPAYFRELAVCAMAGIGNPQKFFNRLHDLGISFTARPFPDHHAYAAGDCAFEGKTAVIMTEKDAVKCERLAGDSNSWWALRVDAALDEALGELILKKIAR
ncbi:MAG: Tetraacyldisaccharide 4-kinase [Betaproteobacteria bacterium]|nr:Tetraacyldisaccharide 4-kinase [Betaproteobacteria bacterium]